MNVQRAPAKKKADELSKYLRDEHPDYTYLKSVFRYLRTELEIQSPKTSTDLLPDVPTEEEIQRYYEAVWHTRNMQDMVMIKTLLYTEVRVKQGIDDALIQPYSGHSSRQSLEVYSRLSIGKAQKEYDGVMGKFPV
ncbi:MAG: hypothetical protein V7K35_16845 [Nostoc sp.]|uniref:hypothetical protein n=1 Tax=Nostoc sp. TaxID=1180 RepID=UPI002FF4C80E